MRMNSCGTCRFARNWRSGTMIDESGVVSSNPRVECHRYPVTCDKREDDRCGEWKPRSVFAVTRYRIENGEEVILGD